MTITKMKGANVYFCCGIQDGQRIAVTGSSIAEVIAKVCAIVGIK